MKVADSVLSCQKHPERLDPSCEVCIPVIRLLAKEPCEESDKCLGLPIAFRCVTCQARYAKS